MSDQTVDAFDRLYVSERLLPEPLSEADPDRGRLLYSLAVDNRHTFEKVFQLYDVLFDC